MLCCGGCDLDLWLLVGTGLAASIDMLGVSLGGILGHAICTGVAVLGGRHLAAHIREKTVAVRCSSISCQQPHLPAVLL